MKPGPKLAFEKLRNELPLDAPPRPLDDLLVEIIKGNFAESYDDPLQRAREWVQPVNRLLKKHLSDCDKRGEQPRFAFNASSEYMIQGSCFIEPADDEKVKEHKRKRLNYKDYFEILRKLTPREFESLCTKIIGLLGVPDPKLTPYQDDQGIDFYGKFSVGDLIGHGAAFPIFETRLVVWLIGQAKHYKHTKVATPDIRDLVGSTFLGRSRVFVKGDKHPDLQIRICDPVIMLFFTTGEISEDGWTLCEKSGVVAMDGEKLAQFLADKNIAMQKQKFSTDLFKKWLLTS